MLYCLMDGRARTATELAMVAEVSPSTASAHLHRLAAQGLVTLLAQGRHRYYSLADSRVAALLEALSLVAGGDHRFDTQAPHELRAARTCYDHIAGALGVALHDRLLALHWIAGPAAGGAPYELTKTGARGLGALGVDLAAARAARRRFAYACVDWSERRPHLAGALGAALLDVARRRRWVTQELDSRALSVTPFGRRDLSRRFGVVLPNSSSRRVGP